MRASLSRLLAFTFTLSFLTAAPAWSQAHETKSGSYTLRSSTVGSDMLPAETARKHGIERSPLRGVLNLTVSNDQQSVPAKIAVEVSNLTGRTRPIAMSKTSANGYVSYMGTYDFSNGEVLDFSVQAQPQGSNEVMRLNFRERMWDGGDLPETQH